MIRRPPRSTLFLHDALPISCGLDCCRLAGRRSLVIRTMWVAIFATSESLTTSCLSLAVGIWTTRFGKMSLPNTIIGGDLSEASKSWLSGNQIFHETEQI